MIHRWIQVDRLQVDSDRHRWGLGSRVEGLEFRERGTHRDKDRQRRKRL